MSKFTLIPLSALALTAACGGGGGSTGPEVTVISPEEEATRVFTVDAGNFSTALAAAPLTARSVTVSALEADYDADTTSLTDTPEITVLKNADGALSFIIDGEQVDFTPADRSGDYGYVQDPGDDSYENIFVYSGGTLDDWYDTATGGNAEAFSVLHRPDPSQPLTRAFGIIGTETEDAALAGLGTVFYNGRGQLIFLPAENFGSFSADADHLRGTLMMEADFDGGTISGTLTDLTLEEDNSGIENALPGTITMNEAIFDVNGYQGTLSADADLLTAADVDSVSGTYGGAFYGDAAQETAGSLSATTSDSEGGSTGIGFFIGAAD